MGQVRLRFSSVLLTAAALALAGCGSSPTDPSSTPTAAGGATASSVECPPADGSAERVTSFPSAPPMCIDPAKTYTATMETDAGTMTIALDAAQAPRTVNNFVVLSRYHYYDGLTFHRVIQSFMAQGGDPEGTGAGGPGYEFEDELPEAGEYTVGSVAMANAGPDTNGSQFFIVSGPAGEQLPPNYSLFGQVTEGLDTLRQIEADGSASEGPPAMVHTITKVTITEE